MGVDNDARTRGAVMTGVKQQLVLLQPCVAQTPPPPSHHQLITTSQDPKNNSPCDRNSVIDRIAIAPPHKITTR